MWKKKKTTPPTPPKKYLPLEDAIAEISACWLNLFPAGQLRPVAIGLREILLQDIKLNHLAISAQKLKHYLSAISHSMAYRTTIMPRAERYDKDGQPAGTVKTSICDAGKLHFRPKFPFEMKCF